MNRCPKCKSASTWDDMTMWGCNDCGWMGSNMPIGLVETSTGKVTPLRNIRKQGTDNEY